MDLQVEIEKVQASPHKESVIMVRLKGRLDINTSPYLEKQLAPLLAQDEKFFVINLANVRYISSSGLKLLLSLRLSLKRKSGKLILCASNEFITELLTISGVITTIQHVKDEELALSSF